VRLCLPVRVYVHAYKRDINIRPWVCGSLHFLSFVHVCVNARVMVHHVGARVLVLCEHARARAQRYPQGSAFLFARVLVCPSICQTWVCLLVLSFARACVCMRALIINYVCACAWAL
jgi:hypothetical protein